MLGVPVGDRVRVVVGRAVKGPIVLAVGFVVFIVTAKDVPALYVHEPWQDDPYDAVISFAFLGVPLLTGLSALRGEMCRRAEALPARRVLDLLRLSRVLIVIALTLGSEWVSVALGVHGEAWTPVTNIVLAVLAALSALTVAAGWQLRRASRACGRTPAPQQPDWLADAATLAASTRGGSPRPSRSWAPSPRAVRRWSWKATVRRSRCSSSPPRAAYSRSWCWSALTSAWSGGAARSVPRRASQFLSARHVRASSPRSHQPPVPVSLKPPRNTAPRPAMRTWAVAEPWIGDAYTGSTVGTIIGRRR